MVWRILRYRNTQAATGVLFVGVIVTFIGELERNPRLARNARAALKIVGWDQRGSAAAVFSLGRRPHVCPRSMPRASGRR